MKHQTQISLTILSDAPFEWTDIADLHDLLDAGEAQITNIQTGYTIEVRDEDDDEPGDPAGDRADVVFDNWRDEILARMKAEFPPDPAHIEV